MNYHNNDTERAVRMLSMMRKILYGSRSERGMRTTEILCTVYATCSLRGVNFYSFVRDYLDGKVAKIPMPAPACTYSGSIASKNTASLADTSKNRSEYAGLLPCRGRMTAVAAVQIPKKHGRFVPKSSFQSPSCYPCETLIRPFALFCSMENSISWGESYSHS